MLKHVLAHLTDAFRCRVSTCNIGLEHGKIKMCHLYAIKYHMVFRTRRKSWFWQHGRAFTVKRDCPWPDGGDIPYQLKKPSVHHSSPIFADFAHFSVRSIIIHIHIATFSRQAKFSYKASRWTEKAGVPNWSILSKFWPLMGFFSHRTCFLKKILFILSFIFL